MRAYRRFSTVQQMSVSLGVFAVAMLVLDSGGLNDWAQRLELGPERSVAVPVCSALHRALRPLGVERQRERALVGLARIGWSDDPAALAAVAPAEPAPIVLAPAPEVPRAMDAGVVAAPAALPASVHLNLAPVATDAPPRVTVLPAIPPVDAEDVRTVALAGDSMMAVGLSSTILHEAPRYKDLAFVSMFKSGTGLARPEVFNWQLEYPAMLKDTKPDYVLVAIGANDGQGFVKDKVVYPFGSPGWEKIYEQRVDAYLRMLEKDGATVVWLELPPMKDDILAARIAWINRIDYAVVSASPHAIWVSTAGLIGDDKGHFRDFGELHGKTVRLRQGDGVHLSDDGAALLAGKLLPWLATQEPKPAAVPVAVPQADVPKP